MEARDTDSLESANNWWDDLSEDQKQHINQGLDDACNGRVISSKEFWEHQHS